MSARLASQEQSSKFTLHGGFHIWLHSLAGTDQSSPPALQLRIGRLLPRLFPSERSGVVGSGNKTGFVCLCNVQLQYILTSHNGLCTRVLVGGRLCECSAHVMSVMLKSTS